MVQSLVEPPTEGAGDTGSRGDLPFRRIAGRFSLDFLNTVAWPAGDASREPLHEYERLTGYGRLVDFMRGTDVIDEAELNSLLLRAERAPDEASQILEGACRMRAALHWALVDVLQGGQPNAGDLAVVQGELDRALAHLRLTPSDGGFTWTWEGAGAAIDHILWPIIRDAADLLTSHDMHRVRLCAGDECGFLFLDTSPNQSRRWCVMQQCGNRAKARRHYERQRSA